jgi:hypothetical protein
VEHDIFIGRQNGHNAVRIKAGLRPLNGVGKPPTAVVVTVARRGLGHRQLPKRVVAVDDDIELVERLDVVRVWGGY